MTHSISVILPTFNKLAFLPRCADSVIAAAERRPDVEIIFIDHGSTDGSWQFVQRLAASHPSLVRAIQSQGGSIAELRNRGAATADGDILVFFDSDVDVPKDYFESMLRVLRETGAELVGCECGIPEGAHWSERVWHQLHATDRDGEVNYLNGANLCVRRETFDAIGGFSAQLTVGEDTDFCARARARGARVYEAQALRVIHLANPKSIHQFYRKEVWRGGGVLRDPVLRRNRVTRTVLMHGAFSLAAALVLLLPSPLSIWQRLALALALVLMMPAIAVSYRILETRRLPDVGGALLLYIAFYFARARALLTTSSR